MMPISAVSATSHVGSASQAATTPLAKQGDSNGFGKLVNNLVSQTNDAQVSSDTAIQDLVTGKTDNIQQVVMAVANAELSFKLFMEIRNKLIDSYNELMRMQF